MNAQDGTSYHSDSPLGLNYQASLICRVFKTNHFVATPAGSLMAVIMTG